MKTFEEFVSGLKRDIDIPSRVEERFEDTLQGLGLETRKKHHFQWQKVAAAAAVFVVLCGTVMASNPALASNLPFVGSIFDKEGEEFVVGDWSLSIPYETDQENSREISVDKKITDSLTIEKLVVSPYQLVIFSDVEDSRPYADMTDGEISDILGGQATAERIEEVRNSVGKEYYEYAVFDQDGKVISFEETDDKEGETAKDIYALQGRKVSQIHIYVTQNEKNMAKLNQAKTEKEAKKLSEKDFVLEISQ